MNKEHISCEPKAESIHGIFESVAARTPNNISVKCSGGEVSYLELDARANFLASCLKDAGVISGDTVAILMSHSLELVVSMLAILKCGAAYLPLDVSNPPARNLKYLEMAKVGVLLATPGWNQALGHGRVVFSTAQTERFSSRLEAFDSVKSAPDDKAYLMFTSGSTGEPKGIVVPHRAVIRLVRNTNYIDIRETDRILQFAPPSFDASTFEFWAALLNGGTLVPYSSSGLDPNILRRDLKDNSITILWLTAALFHLVAEKFVDALDSLRVLLAGGDVLNPKYVNKVFDAVPGITIINGYGPTENTTFTCCHVMTGENRPLKSVPIGKSITGTEIHVLDDHLDVVEKGEVGELYTSGLGVALGYLNEGTRNDAYFDNQKIASGLIYRTGDLVRENERGELEFIGRKDNQIKIRGYRVSLEEVRSAIVLLPKVREAVVHKRVSESGDQLLVAHIKLQDGSEMKVREIRDELGKTLPSYMVPDQFIFDTTLAINSNGKIDRRAIESS